MNDPAYMRVLCVAQKKKRTQHFTIQTYQRHRLAVPRRITPHRWPMGACSTASFAVPAWVDIVAAKDMREDVRDTVQEKLDCYMGITIYINITVTFVFEYHQSTFIVT